VRHQGSVGGTRGWHGVDSWAGRPGDGWRQPGVTRATVEVALGDTWRWADMGMVVVEHLWERRSMRCRALSVDERGSGDGDGGAPVTVMVALQ
jgi:hypothetical protein